MSVAESFSPDWVSPPGDTIRDALAHRNVSLEAFQRALGMTAPATESLLSGELPIDMRIAECLADTLGANRHFWLSREAYFRARVEARASMSRDLDFESFLQQLPIKDMKAFGWLDAFKDLSEKDAAQAFFEDAPGLWREAGPQMMEAVRFRTSFAHETNPAAVAAWLRQGVLRARKLECASWNPEALVAAVPSIRALARTKDPVTFFPKLVDLCRAAGVAVVFVRTPRGCRASGATHFASDQKAIIQLSFRYRSDDHFWFTVFHEIGHLILHQGSPLFVEGQDYEATQEEAEANAYSANILIPPAYEGELPAVRRDFKAVMRLARKIGVSSGILVGQMQNRGLLRHEQMNFLKTRYDWNEIAQISP